MTKETNKKTALHDVVAVNYITKENAVNPFCNNNFDDQIRQGRKSYLLNVFAVD